MSGVACSSPSPTKPTSSSGITWPGPIATCTGTTVRNFRPSAGRPPTKTGSRPLTPIHPEVFERLYTDWSTLQNFQRTRGVLRLMASVIHSLWDNGDRSPLIMPANILLDDPPVQSELNRYLPDNWPPVIERDIDGPNSLPTRIDGEAPNLGRYGACRRVARSIFLGSAPMQTAANQGLGGPAPSSWAASIPGSRRRFSGMPCAGLRTPRPTCTRTGRVTGIRPSRPLPRPGGRPSRGIPAQPGPGG